MIELLIVVTIMAILTALVLPGLGSNIHEQLQATGQTVVDDMAYGRNLAVSNGSKFLFTFDLANNRYVLTHSGTNNLLDDLPSSALQRSDDLSTQQTHDLSDIPQVGQRAELVAVYRMAGSPTAVTKMEFGSLGSTTRAEQTVVWLGCGDGTERRYLSINIDAVTGLASLGDYQSTVP